MILMMSRTDFTVEKVGIFYWNNLVFLIFFNHIIAFYLFTERMRDFSTRFYSIEKKITVVERENKKHCVISWIGVSG